MRRRRSSFTLLVPPGETVRRRLLLPLLAAALALPLVITSGAGQEGSRSFGLTLFGGYLLFALLGLPLATALRFPVQTCQKKRDGRD